MRAFLGVVVCALAVAACAEASSEPTTTLVPATTQATTTVAHTTTTGVPTTRELYEAVSPSLAFITTDFGVGSGVLIEEGYIVTNAHVVWPFEEVRVVFPDGTEILDAPVVRANTYEDLALVGPVSVSAPPLEMAEEPVYGIGDTVFLVGYPGEIEEFPEPAITQGVISRVREWEDADLTFIQTDALIAGGQSGGALVAATGEVLGVSGLGGFSESNFALVAAADDLEPRIDALLAGTTPGRFTINEQDLGPAATEHELELASYWHDRVLVISEPAGTTIDVEVSDADHFVTVTDALGFALNPDEDPVASLTFTTEFAEPHYVFVSSLVAGPTSVEVTSTVPMSLLRDPDDDLPVARGDFVNAVMDVSGDFDVFRITLAAGDTITVRVDSLFDPRLWIDTADNVDDPLAFDDDSGGGLFGTNAEIRFTADEDGEYLIVVADNIGEPGGGYVLTIS